MNKSRRMAALQARALADAGWSVMQVDLFGCGDSDGDFSEADWEQWQTDIRDAANWLRQQTGHQPAFWGLRTGCLLACEVAGKMAAAPNLLLWQPSLSGRQSLQQFLRLKVASQLFKDSTPDRITTKQLYESLSRGDSAEVAGYALASALAMGLDASELKPPALATRVAWLEVRPDTPPEISPAARDRIQSWRAAGHQIDGHAVTGEAFWQTQEIAESRELIKATLALVADWRR